MDAEQLRWTLLIIGLVLIIAVYLFGRHQAKLRNRAALKTYTQDEIDEPYIDDDTLRQELQHIDHVLADDDEVNFKNININPGIEAENTAHLEEETFIQEHCEVGEHLVSYLLKRSDGTRISKKMVQEELSKAGFLSNEKNSYLYFDQRIEVFSVALKLDDAENYVTSICFFMDSVMHRKNAKQSFEVMLRVIDILTSNLLVKVYNRNQSLLTIDDITLIRKQLLNIDDESNE